MSRRTPTKYWRLSVKNSIYNRFVLMSLLACVAVVIACQKSALPEYKKFQTEAEVPRISPADAKKELDAGTAVIIDSRAADAYKMEHIAGAISLPIGSPPEKFDSLPKDKKLIIYCS